MSSPKRQFGEFQLGGVTRKSLSEFKFVEILNYDQFTGILTILATLDEKPGIVKMIRGAINDEKIERILSNETVIELDMDNDPYHTYAAAFPSDTLKDRLSIVYPAEEWQINKEKRVDFHIIQESGGMYEAVTKKAMVNPAKLEWVYNILNGKKEADRILFQNSNLVAICDMKWDPSDLKSLYVQVLPKGRDIHSIRDLRKDHIPLLNEMKRESERVIQAKYGIKASRLRMFFHYHPTFWHLHLHIQILDRYEGNPQRVHSLHSVLETLIDNRTYESCSLEVTLKESDKLYHDMEAYTRKETAIESFCDAVAECEMESENLSRNCAS